MGISKKLSIFCLLMLANTALSLDIESLHSAISNGDLNAVSSVINKRPELLASTSTDGDTVLHMAVLSNNMDITQLLVNAAKSYNPKLLYVRSRTGLTILHLAQIQMDPNPKLIEYLKEIDPELSKIPLRSCF